MVSKKLKRPKSWELIHEIDKKFDEYSKDVNGIACVLVMVLVRRLFTDKENNYHNFTGIMSMISDAINRNQIDEND